MVFIAKSKMFKLFFQSPYFFLLLFLSFFLVLFGFFSLLIIFSSIIFNFFENFKSCTKKRIIGQGENFLCSYCFDWCRKPFFYSYCFFVLKECFYGSEKPKYWWLEFYDFLYFPHWLISFYRCIFLFTH